MTVIGEVFVAIRPQTGNFEADLHKGVTPGATKVAKTLGAAIGGAFVVGKIRDFAKAGIDELKAAEAAHAQTAQAIKSTGGAANVTADQVEALAGQQLKLTGVDDELIQKGANLLLTFTRVRNEVGKGNDIFDQATVAALDLSRAGFGSVESASVLLGKALNDPVQGLTALQRVGVRLTDGQKETVKALVATGDVLGAQKVILEEVNTQVGGSAEAYGKTLPGQLAIAQESLDNTRGMLVAGMAPALTLTAGATTFLTEQFAKQPQVLQAVEGGLLLTVGALGAIITPLKSGIDLWRSFGAGAQVAGAAADIAAPVRNSATAVDGLYASSGRMTGRFGTFATSALGAATAVGLVWTAVQLLDGEADHADLSQLSRDLLDFTESGKASGEVADLLGGNIEKLSDDLDRLTKPRPNDATGPIDDLTQALKLTDDPLEQTKAHIDDLDKALASLAGQDPAAAAAALGAIKDALPPDQAKALVKLLNDYDSAVAATEVSSRLAAGGIDEVGGAAVDAGAEVGGLAGSVDALVGGVREVDSVTGLAERSTKRYAEEMADAREAMDLLFGSTTSAIGSSLDYRDAVDAGTDALAELILLEAQGKAGTDEYRRAVDDTARALFAQSEAAAQTAVDQYALAGAELNAGQKAAIQKAELERLRDTLAPGNPLRTQLQGMIDQLGLVVSKQVTVDVNVAQAMANVAALAGQVNQLTDQYLQYTIGSVFKAKGGPVGLPAYRAVGGSASQLVMSGGPRGTDTIPAWLTPGEFVFQKSAVDRLGLGVLNALNRGTHTLDAGGNTWVHLTFGPGSVVLPPMRDTRDAYLHGAKFADGVRERLAERSLTVQTRAQA